VDFCGPDASLPKAVGLGTAGVSFPELRFGLATLSGAEGDQSVRRPKTLQLLPSRRPFVQNDNLRLPRTPFMAQLLSRIPLAQKLRFNRLQQNCSKKPIH